jgi:hypothetical protein
MDVVELTSRISHAEPRGKPQTTANAQGLQKAAEHTDAEGVAKAAARVEENARVLPEGKGKSLDLEA